MSRTVLGIKKWFAELVNALGNVDFVRANEVRPFAVMVPPNETPVAPPKETPGSLREEASELLKQASAIDDECAKVVDDPTAYVELIEAIQAEVAAVAEASHEAEATVTTANAAEVNCRRTLDEIDEKIRRLQAERRQAVDGLDAAITERLRVAAEKSGLDLHLFERKAALAVAELRQERYARHQAVTRSDLLAQAAEKRAQAWRLFDHAARQEANPS